MKREESIVFENGTHWVEKICEGSYKVWKTGLTHSTLAGTVDFKSGTPEQISQALPRAIAEAERQAVRSERSTFPSVRAATAGLGAAYADDDRAQRDFTPDEAVVVAMRLLKPHLLPRTPETEARWKALEEGVVRSVNALNVDRPGWLTIAERDAFAAVTPTLTNVPLQPDYAIVLAFFECSGIGPFRVVSREAAETVAGALKKPESIALAASALSEYDGHEEGDAYRTHLLARCLTIDGARSFASHGKVVDLYYDALPLVAEQVSSPVPSL